MFLLVRTSYHLPCALYRGDDLQEIVRIAVSTPSSTPPETSPVCKTENARDLVLGSPFSLPSITDFDKGVEALAKSSDCPPAKAPATPPPDLRKHSIGFHMQNDHHPQYRHSRDHMGYQLQYQAPHSYPGRFMRRGLYQGQVDMPYFDFNKPPASYMAEAAYRDSFSSDGGQELSLDSDADRHINQKYSTEEGDWIIYAMHEEGLKWNACKEAFARRFGTTPHRSVQGLQAWYYRMNGRIPVWDADGWLCFDNEDEIEPKYVAIKCRSRDAVGSSSEQLGLIQRYPERAIQYDWVGIEHKYKARDWGKCYGRVVTIHI